jgi:hypothetical protein
VGHNYQDSAQSIKHNIINLYTQEHGYFPLAERYIPYNEGDDFNEYYDKHLVSIDDTRSEIQKQIESGRIDYLIKLEHAEGNTTNLFTPSKKSKLLTFYKPGTKDKLYLIIPEENGTRQSVSGQDFGKWMSQRKSVSDNALDLFSGSCSSFIQTRKMFSHMMAEVSKNGKHGDKLPLRVYPTTSITAFNVGNKEHPTNAMMNAYLNNKSYKEIREAMSEKPIYQRGNDHYIFPNDEDYKKKLIGDNKYSYGVKASVTVIDEETGASAPLKSLSEQLH